MIEAETPDVSGAPRVSTIIPAYNAAAFIARAIDSALAQNIDGHDIVVVDDASSDRTAEVVSAYFARGVRLIRHRTSQGAAAARNTGIVASHAPYIAFLDADDEWLAGKLQRQLALLRPCDDMSFVACRADLIEENGFNSGDIYRGAPPAVGPEAWRRLLAYPSVATPTVVARRSALLKAGLFNRWLRVAEDQDMWIRLALLGQVGYVPDTLVRVYSTPNSLSKAGIREQANILLPMIESYICRNSGRMTRAEARMILGERLSRLGRHAYSSGSDLYGFAVIMRAVAYRHRPAENLLYLVRASALVRWLKRRLAPVLRRASPRLNA